MHPDSLSNDGKARPTFKSDAGRAVYGGGGIRPDVIVADDTLSTRRARLPARGRAAAQAINTVLQDYALELKGTVSPRLHGARDVGAGAHASPRRGRRQDRPEVRLPLPRELLTRDLANRVTRLAFGDAAAKDATRCPRITSS